MPGQPFDCLSIIVNEPRAKFKKNFRIYNLHDNQGSLLVV